MPLLVGSGNSSKSQPVCRWLQARNVVGTAHLEQVCSERATCFCLVRMLCFKAESMSPVTVCPGKDCRGAGLASASFFWSANILLRCCRNDKSQAYQDGTIEEYDYQNDCYLLVDDHERFAVQFHQFTVEEEERQLVLKVTSCSRISLPAGVSPVVSKPIIAGTAATAADSAHQSNRQNSEAHTPTPSNTGGSAHGALCRCLCCVCSLI